VALLQGLAICGRCGRRMSVRYHVFKGCSVPTYTCVNEAIQKGGTICQVILGSGLDDTVVKAVLEAVTPSTIELALEVFEELRTRKAEADRLLRAQVERAREEAELAQHQYLLVRPENRLVADNLERLWNEKLNRLAQAEEEYRRASKTGDSTVGPEDRERIQSLASDLPRVWNDPRTSSRERKRMLRLLIEDVTLTRDEVIRIDIRWKGGATTHLERPLPLRISDLRRTPAEIVEIVRALAAEQTDKQIARIVHARGLRSGTGIPFTRKIIRFIRTTYKIESLAQRLRREGWLTVPEMAKVLEVHYSTAKRFALEGLLRAVRADDGGLILIEPFNGPLPKTHRGKRFRDRRVFPQLTPHVRSEVQYEA
jgi:hypothetical protein